MSTLKANQPFSNRYHLIRRIGLGGYSEVWLASDTLAGNMQVALKIFAPDKGLDEQGIALFSKEYSLVFNLHHANLLLPKHFDVADGSPFLVLPYCEAGSVFSKIGMMSEPDLARFLQQSASALAYLHSQEPPIIHQDIKPDNFLIDNQGNYLLSDFGISSKIRRTLTRSMGAPASAGTMAYMPPEKFSADKQVIKAGDIFSLGVTLYELLTGDLPFGDNGGLTLKAGADVPNLPAGFSPELNELLKRCMAKETWERPTGEELIQIAKHFLSTDMWQSAAISVAEPIPPQKQGEPLHRPTQPIPIIVESALDKAIAAGEFSNFFKQTGIKPDDIKKGGFYIELLKKWGHIGLEEFEQAFDLQKADYEKQRPALLYIPEADMEFIWVEGGTFMMGSEDGKEDEKPVHQVTLDGFYLGKTAVTQKQWKMIIGNNPSYFKGENLPVESVSWYDTKKYIERLFQMTGSTFRLPTEAEWEYAAGGGQFDRTKFSGTNYEDKLADYAWFKANSGGTFWKSGRIQPVATRLPNRLNLFDMSGNVWEWCEDFYKKYSHDGKINPQEPEKGLYCVRGGSYVNDPFYCRTSFRNYSLPDNQIVGNGFRLCYVF
jgi:formylglycine-generating enzyme required for sulfatase activity/serine/threonine protein kinase